MKNIFDGSARLSQAFGVLLFAALSIASMPLSAPVLARSIPARESPAFPLNIVHEGGRAYFVDQSRAPFLVSCEIAQGMLNRLKIEDVRYYLDSRKSHGYNTFWFIIATPGVFINDTKMVDVGPNNANGAPPFNNLANDLSRPNDEYFEYVRQIVEEAAQRGMMVGIAPAYVGYSGGDLLTLMKHSGIAGCRSYGGYLGTFFRECANIFWIHHGDENAYNFGGIASAALVDAVVEGIMKTDSRYTRFHTAITRMVFQPPVIPASNLGASSGSAQLNSSNQKANHKPWLNRTSSYNAQFDATGLKVNPMPWLNVNNVYVKNRGLYSVMLADMLNAWDTYRYNTEPRLPYIILDGVCEHFHDIARANRAQGYYALLSGAVGYFTGNIRICWFISPDIDPDAKQSWKDEINDRESMTATYTSKLFSSLPWWKLIPDTSRKLFTSGDSLCAAAKTNDNMLAVLYMPTHRAVTADLKQMGGRMVRANWFNPRTGRHHRIGIFTGVAQVFTPPIESEDDHNDWVLLLEAP